MLDLKQDVQYVKGVGPNTGFKHFFIGKNLVSIQNA